MERLMYNVLIPILFCGYTQKKEKYLKYIADYTHLRNTPTCIEATITYLDAIPVSALSLEWCEKLGLSTFDKDNIRCN